MKEISYCTVLFTYIVDSQLHWQGPANLRYDPVRGILVYQIYGIYNFKTDQYGGTLPSEHTYIMKINTPQICCNPW